MRLGTNAAWALASLLGALAAGCGDDTSGSGSGGSGSGTGGSGSTTDATASTTTTSGDTSSTATGSDGLEVPGGAGQAAKPAYVEGPYGVGVDSVIADYSFVGYTRPSVDRNALEVVSLSDFYNPTADGVFPDDGRMWAGQSKPKALAISVAAFWCGPCKDESREVIPAQKASKGPNGAEFLVLLADGKNPGTVPVVSELNQWVNMFDMEVPAALDSALVFEPLWEANAFPENILIRTSDMRIMAKVAGVPTPAYWSLMQSILNNPLP